jgi:glyoxylase-like metal-dependent hydrolase (beta-lactamase superfamily II)/8-oxo-dGTP pyrophosphatase MutT (NUDIX family)
MADAVEPRPAATVVLLRPGPNGLETLLTQRPSTMAFAGDMHVFPGGRVDGADADPSLVARSALSPEAAAIGLGGDLAPEVALAAHVAAIRELFEEAGVLLAETRGSAGGPTTTARIAAGRSALLAGDTTMATLADELDLTLRTDLLVPLSRWVTPPIMPRRFDVRFFAAVLQEGAAPTFEGAEVVAHAWFRPGDALVAMAEGRLGMWVPTSATLQQIEHARSIEEIRERLSPLALGPIEVEAVSLDVTRIVMPAGGGVAGQPVCAYLVGRRRFVLVDPGDPTGPAFDRAIEIATERGGAIEAVGLTNVDPDHTASAEGIAQLLGVPILAGPGAGRPLPYTVRELADMEAFPAGDVPLRTVHAPGPRPDHVAFIGEAFALTGDLDGTRGARSIPGPSDEAAWAASRERVAGLVPRDRWLAGHPRTFGAV